MSTKHNRVGEVNFNTKGEKMVITEYKGCSDVTVQFEDGTIREGIVYSSFKSGRVSKVKRGSIEASRSQRIGEVGYNSDGEQMTIVEYRGCNDIDVQFEDGTIRRCITYACFKRGGVSKEYRCDYSSIRIGESSVSNEGYRMTIIAYRSAKDIDVQFEDGTIKKGVIYRNFKLGNILKDRIGEVNYNYEGEKMTIVSYDNRYRISVQFEDGTVCNNISYYNFKRGHVSKNSQYYCSNNINSYYNFRVGEESVNTDGLHMVIVAYRNARDIDVQFDDGVIREHCEYASFKRGSIRHPNFKTNELIRVGEIGYNSRGERMVITEYRSSEDMDVIFDDGVTRTGVSYGSFTKGRVSKYKQQRYK